MALRAAYLVNVSPHGASRRRPSQRFASRDLAPRTGLLLHFRGVSFYSVRIYGELKKSPFQIFLNILGHALVLSSRMSLIFIFTDLHSGVEHLPAQCVHQLRGRVEREDLGHEQLLAPLHL